MGRILSNKRYRTTPKKIVRFPARLRLLLRMKEDQHRFLSLLGQLPARLTAEQAAWVLNCQPHDVPILVSSRLLRPLGNPPANGIKFFATADVLEAAKDRSWLAKMTNTISQYWRGKNGRKKTGFVNSAYNGLSPLFDVATTPES
jgi:hypothetical protein